jgi:hypothetical protein
LQGGTASALSDEIKCSFSRARCPEVEDEHEHEHEHDFSENEGTGQQTEPSRKIRYRPLLVETLEGAGPSAPWIGIETKSTEQIFGLLEDWAVFGDSNDGCEGERLSHNMDLSV